MKKQKSWLSAVFMVLACMELFLNLAVAQNLESNNAPNADKNLSVGSLKFGDKKSNNAQNDFEILSSLFEAILQKDYALSDEIIAQNPDILTHYYEVENGKINALGYAIRAYSHSPNEQIALIEYLRRNHNLDINSKCMYVADGEAKFEYSAIALVLLSKSGFETFRYFATHKTDPAQFFGYVYYAMPQAKRILNLLKNQDFEAIKSYLQTDEYKAYEIRHLAAVREIFANYKYSDFAETDIKDAARIFIATDDDKIFAELLNFGLKDDEKLLSTFRDWAKQTDAIKILKLLKGY